MIPVRVTYTYRENQWAHGVRQQVTLEIDPACTRLHQIADMIGGPLIIGGNTLSHRTVESVEIGARARHAKGWNHPRTPRMI